MTKLRLPLFPIIILTLAVAGVAYVRWLPEFERNLKGWLTAGIPLLALMLNLIWFVFTKRFSGRTRLLGVITVVLIFFGLRAAVRVDGTVDGTGTPNFVWKWSHSSRPAMAPIRAESSAPRVMIRDSPRQPMWRSSLARIVMAW